MLASLFFRAAPLAFGGMIVAIGLIVLARREGVSRRKSSFSARGRRRDAVAHAETRRRTVRTARRLAPRPTRRRVRARKHDGPWAAILFGVLAMITFYEVIGWQFALLATGAWIVAFAIWGSAKRKNRARKDDDDLDRVFR